MYVSGKFVDHSTVMMKEHDGYANHATTLTQVESTFQEKFSLRCQASSSISAAIQGNEEVLLSVTLHDGSTETGRMGNIQRVCSVC